MTTPVRTVCTAWAVVCLMGCGGSKADVDPEVPPATPPLPSLSLAGQAVVVLPLTFIAAVDTVPDVGEWRDRGRARAMADSIISENLLDRAPEVNWVLPPRLREVRARNPVSTPDPDRMGQSILRDLELETVPDPLRAKIRNLIAIASGGRYAVVPAALIFRVAPSGEVRAALTIVVIDARRGTISFRAVAMADGPDPLTAFDRAMKNLTPIDP